MRNKDTNANNLIEVPTFRNMMPDFNDKCILDLGCICSWN